MKKLILLLSLFTLFANAQVTAPTRNAGGFGAGFTTNDMAASAIIEARSTTKGFLAPRMTTTQRNAISSPATGLQVYNTTTNKFNYYNGSAWVEFGGGTGTTPTLSQVLTAGDRETVLLSDGAAHTLVLADAVKYLVQAEPYNIVLNSGVFPDNTEIYIYNGSGTEISITGTANVFSNTTIRDNTLCIIKKVVSDDTWTSSMASSYPITKTELGLQYIDNTSDLNKPVSTATQTALNLKEDKSNKSNSIIGNETSTTKYLSNAGISDYLATSWKWLTPGNNGFGYWISVGLSDMTTPVDNDQLVIGEYGTSTTKRLSLGTQKTYFKNYFDTLYQNKLSGTGFVKVSGTTVSYDNSTYLTANQAISFTPNAAGDVTGSSTGNTNITPLLMIGSGKVNSGHITDGTIVNADINSSAAIDATKISTGSVSNTEFGYLDGVTSAVQTQIDSKQGKSMSAYSFNANNTNTTANASELVYRSVGQQAYTLTPTFGGTAPSGTENKTYNWQQIGNSVQVVFTFDYSTAGATITTITIPMPADMPAPVIPTGFSGSSSLLYIGSGHAALSPTNSGASSSDMPAYLRLNSAGTGYEFGASFASAGYRTFRLSIQYYTN